VHLSVLLGLMALTRRISTYLAQFALTKFGRDSRRGHVHGHPRAPSRSAVADRHLDRGGRPVHRQHLAARVGLPIIAVGLWGFISIVVGTIYPAGHPEVPVQPNELTKEQPYIQAQTSRRRRRVRSLEYNDATVQLRPEVEQSRDDGGQVPTIDNTRLYDPLQHSTRSRPRRKSRRSIRSVMSTSTATRSATRARSRSWRRCVSSTSRTCRTTRGRASTSSTRTANGGRCGGGQRGEPRPASYLLDGIPPTGDIQLNANTAGVYFGEGLGGYSIVDTKVAEQEATSTGNTKPITYQGKAGVKVSSFLRKTALALRFGDWNLWVSGQVTSNSRVIYSRDIMQRVKTVAPFLKFDSDPTRSW